mmetsp:Transcript_112835/g.199146  ORF Transcript_112835/g.199146 Transcript_112835/m.199146 type:complete len:81 (-) Transcript_112835:5-247(-)
MPFSNTNMECRVDFGKQLPATGRFGANLKTSSLRGFGMSNAMDNGLPVSSARWGPTTADRCKALPGSPCSQRANRLMHEA